MQHTKHCSAYLRHDGSQAGGPQQRALAACVGSRQQQHARLALLAATAAHSTAQLQAVGLDGIDAASK
jgi:hypothetical protein